MIKPVSTIIAGALGRMQPRRQQQPCGSLPSSTAHASRGPAGGPRWLLSYGQPVSGLSCAMPYLGFFSYSYNANLEQKAPSRNRRAKDLLQGAVPAEASPPGGIRPRRCLELRHVVGGGEPELPWAQALRWVGPVLRKPRNPGDESAARKPRGKESWELAKGFLRVVECGEVECEPSARGRHHVSLPLAPRRTPCLEVGHHIHAA